ncbi:MAG: hypothetical protein AAF468_11495 [Pseudomonadota bacterium]
MSDQPEFDEDGFPIYRPSEEELARTREQMNRLVDCRKLANEMMTSLPEADAELLAQLKSGHGIDGMMSLTEIEGEDLGDTYDEADEPIVHALRYVPVARWLPSDVRLMLAYGHGIDIGLLLAEWLLRDDVMLEAEYHSGDLLELFCGLAIGRGRRDRVEKLTARFENSIWDKFQHIAKESDMDTATVEKQRVRLLNGVRSEPGQNPFLKIERDLKTLANLKNDLWPPRVIAKARTKQLFARYRPRKSVELVLLPDLDVAEYRATINDPDTFKFRRDTDFNIVQEQNEVGVRLRIFSASAMDHKQGIWFEDVAAAKAAALEDYGIGALNWEDL